MSTPEIDRYAPPRLEFELSGVRWHAEPSGWGAMLTRWPTLHQDLPGVSRGDGSTFPWPTPAEIAVYMAADSTADPGCTWKGRVSVAQAAPGPLGLPSASLGRYPIDGRPRATNGQFRPFPARMDAFTLLERVSLS